MAKEHILIIDSSIKSRRFISDEVLRPNGYQTSIAGDNEAGLQLALVERPDLILLELSQAETTINLVSSLRHQGAECPVVLMTAQDTDSVPLQFLRLGVEDFAAKPVQPTELSAVIERVLSGTRLRRERYDLAKRLAQAERLLEQHRRELNTLFGIGKSVTALHNQGQLLRRFVEAAIYLTNAEESSILLLDEETNELYVAATRGMDDRVARSLRLKVDDSLAGEAVRNGQAFVLNETDIKKIKTDYLVRALMYVPISTQGQVKGVLGVSNRQQMREFSNHDLRLLSALSDYAAVFLETIQLSKLVDHEKTKLTTLLDELKQPVAMISEHEDRIILTNAAFRRTFEVSQASSEKHLRLEMLKNQALADFISAPPGVDKHRGEIFLDDERTFAATLIPIPTIGRALVMQDVTELKTFNKMKSDFISAVSHTMQSPLVSVRQYADMLRAAGSLTEKQEIFFERMTTGLEKMIALVSNLLDLNRAELELDLNSTIFDLSHIAVEVITEFQNQARRKRQRLVYHSPNEPAYVSGVPVRLKQVITQLVDNAVEYTSENGHVLAIVQVNNDQVLFKVEDNGPGIPPADQPFVFDKFFRVDQKNESGNQGTGLGLAICKSIIEKSGGSIWVESVPGKGSTFFFTLPLASPQAIETEHSNALNTEAIVT